MEQFDKQDTNYSNKLQVLDIMGGLDSETVNILEQRFFHNMTMKEIGKKNGYSRETARRRLRNAIKICKTTCE